MKSFVLNAEWAPKEDYVLSEREKRDRGRAIIASKCFKNLKAYIEERPIPEIKEDEVLIRMGACGICGSDIHAVKMSPDGYCEYGNHLRLPVVLGHEFSGEVVKVGNQVTEVRVGDLIAVEQIRYCGKCVACRKGYYNQCLNMEEIGLSADGGFSEYVAVPERFCCDITPLAELYGSKESALEAGALVEPTGVAYNGMIVAGGGIKPGVHVVVYGAGPIGQAAVAIAKASGAAEIICIDTVPERLKLAETMGATCTVNAKALEANVCPSDIVKEKTRGLGAGVIVEATGAHSIVYAEIEKIMAVGAHIIQLGVGNSPAQINLIHFQRGQAVISGSLGTAGSDIFPSVIRLMETGRIDMRPIITGRFSLEQTADAIALAMTPGQGKIIVTNF